MNFSFRTDNPEDDLSAGADKTIKSRKSMRPRATLPPVWNDPQHEMATVLIPVGGDPQPEVVYNPADLTMENTSSQPKPTVSPMILREEASTATKNG